MSKRQKIANKILALLMMAVIMLGAIPANALAEEVTPEYYTVDIAQTDGGTISFSDSEGDSGIYAYGEKVTLLIGLDEGYTVDYLRVLDNETGDVLTDYKPTAKEVTFKMPECDITVFATFAEAQILEVNEYVEDNEKEAAPVYLRDEDGNIILDEEGNPIVDESAKAEETDEMQNTDSANDTMQYIMDNANPAYISEITQIEGWDFMYTKHTYVLSDLVDADETIDSFTADWDKILEATVTQTENVNALYDTGADNEYVIGYINPMHDDFTINTLDVDFAKGNLYGEVLTDIIYEPETGLVYVPKYIREESEYGVLASQAQFLHGVKSKNAETEIKVDIYTDEEDARLIGSGTAYASISATEAYLRITNDDDLLSVLSPENIQIAFNGSQIQEEFNYDSNTGTIQFSAPPATIDSIQVYVAKDSIFQAIMKKSKELAEAIFGPSEAEAVGLADMDPVARWETLKITPGPDGIKASDTTLDNRTTHPSAPITYAGEYHNDWFVKNIGITPTQNRTNVYFNYVANNGGLSPYPSGNANGSPNNDRSTLNVSWYEFARMLGPSDAYVKANASLFFHTALYPDTILNFPDGTTIEASSPITFQLSCFHIGSPIDIGRSELNEAGPQGWTGFGTVHYRIIENMITKEEPVLDKEGNQAFDKETGEPLMTIEGKLLLAIHTSEVSPGGQAGYGLFAIPYDTTGKPDEPTFNEGKFTKVLAEEDKDAWENNGAYGDVTGARFRIYADAEGTEPAYKTILPCNIWTDDNGVVHHDHLPAEKAPYTGTLTPGADGTVEMPISGPPGTEECKANWSIDSENEWYLVEEQLPTGMRWMNTPWSREYMDANGTDSPIVIRSNGSIGSNPVIGGVEYDFSGNKIHNYPDYGYLTVIKEDSVTGAAQQGASLAGAVFKVDYYDNVDGNHGGAPKRTWFYQTLDKDNDKKGEFVLGEYEYLLDSFNGQASDPLFEFHSADVHNGKNLSQGLRNLNPRGTYVITEVKSPPGYALRRSTWGVTAGNKQIQYTDGGTYQGADDANDFVQPLVAIIKGECNGGTDIMINGATINSEEVTNFDDVYRNDLAFTKTAADTGAPLAYIPFRITNDVTGESHIVVTDGTGYYSSSAERTDYWAKHGFNTNAGDKLRDRLEDERDKSVTNEELAEASKSGTWFEASQDGTKAPIDEGKGAFAYGTYTIDELPAPNNEWGVGKYVLIKNAKITMDKDRTYYANPDNGIFEAKGEYELALLNVPESQLPNITTQARTENTDNRWAYADEDCVIIDDVQYSNLLRGHKYIIRGRLMDMETGEPVLDAQGNPIEAEVPEFIAEAGVGHYELEYPIDAGVYAGKAIVVFEYLYEVTEEESNYYFNPGGTPVVNKKETLVAWHTDWDDSQQTIYFAKIGTSALAKQTKANVVKAQKDIVIVDTVSYWNLQPNRAYEIHGKLIDKETGNVIRDKNGNPVEATQKFKPEERDGTVDVTFVFDGTDLAGTTVVAFEKLTRLDRPVAVHEDIEDEAQTVYIPEIKTTAVDKETGDHQALPDGYVSIIDEVRYTDLAPNKEYTIKGMLYDKATGKPLLVYDDAVEEADNDDYGFQTDYFDKPYSIQGKTGREVTAEKTFTPESPDGSVQISFVINAKALVGKAVVAFESLEYKSIEVAVHADINDEEQTVYFPEIHTTALDKASGTHQLVAKDEITIVDKVEYKNLIPGRTYKLEGILMSKASGTYLGKVPLNVPDGNISIHPEDAIGWYTTDDTPSLQGTGTNPTTVPRTYWQSKELAHLHPVGDGYYLDSGAADYGQSYKNVKDAVSYSDNDTVLSSNKGKADDRMVDVLKSAVSDETNTIEEPIIVNDVRGANIEDENTAIRDESARLIEETPEITADTDPNEALNSVFNFSMRTEAINNNTETRSPIVRSIEFTPTSKDGFVELEFKVQNANNFLGHAIVVFEYLYLNGHKVAEHEDLDDEDQTIYVPRIATSLTDIEGNKTVATGDRLKLVDTVEYVNLIPGQKYAITGYLMDKETGVPLYEEEDGITQATKFVKNVVGMSIDEDRFKDLIPANNMSVIGEKMFTPTERNGQIKVEFDVDANLAKGKTLVAYEYLQINGEDVATHEDINDAAQTVNVTGKPPRGTPPTVKTGDTMMPILLLIMIAGVTVSFIVYRRKRNSL